MTWILIVGLLLAFANGSNDNLKGVASLLGSGTSDYRRALAWATATTLAGSCAAIFLADELLGRFRGKGLVPNELTLEPMFLGAVALGAALTVLCATRLAMPVSTTHSLVGSLVGAGIAAVGAIDGGALMSYLLAPLILSPLIAMLGTALLYPVLRAIRVRFNVTRDTCFCIGSETIEVHDEALAPLLAMQRRAELRLHLGDAVISKTRYHGQFMGLRIGPGLDGLHYLSAGALGFARGLNDTPKIAGLMLVMPSISPTIALLICGLTIAAGGLLAAKRVARTMSFDITPMNQGQGLATNAVSAVCVLIATPMGLPVSTTHVVCGAMFGLGLTQGGMNGTTVSKILIAWIVTMPVAGLIAWGALQAMQS